MWFPEFGHSLSVSMAHIAAAGDVEHMHLMRCESSKLACARMDLAKAAIEQGADKILWCDVDHAFKPHHVKALLAHDLDIVAANYAKKTPSQESVCSDLNGKVLTRKTGLEEVAHVGFGLCVTKVSVFKALPKPWFQFQWDAETEDDIGEDVFFCRRARAAGFKVHVDHDASVGVQHIGKFPFQVQ